MNPKVYACIGAGSCLTGFVASSLPYLQFIALVITIVAGVKAFFGKRK